MNLLQQKLTLDRFFFRLVITGLVIAFLVSQFSWAGRLFARIWNFPELRHCVALQPSSEDNMSTVQLSITNSGFGSAEKVLIHINAIDSQILRYQIDAQELYEIKTANLEQGIFDIWLDRLASGARVDILIAGESLTPEKVRLSAASNQGSSLPIEHDTFSDQVREYSGSTKGIFSQSWSIVVRSTAFQKASDWFSTKPFLVHFLEIVKGDEFHTVGLAVLIIVLIVGLFFSYKHFIIAAVTGTWFLTWLFFFSVEIPIKWVTIPVGVLIAKVVWVWFDDYLDDDKLRILLFALVLACLGFLILFFWNNSVSASWILGIFASYVVVRIIDLAEILPPLSGGA